MATTFLDASAIVKLVLHEPESQALIDFLDTRTGVEASELSIAEVGRAVRRFVRDAGALQRRRIGADPDRNARHLV